MPSPIVVELLAKADQFQSQMGQAEKTITRLSKRGGSDIDKLAAVGKAAFFGLGAAAVGFGAIAVKAAAEQEEANARLNTALRNVGSNMTATGKPVEALSAKMRQLGFDDADAVDSLAKLTSATKNPQQGLRDVALAADIARGRHIDLAAATDLLTKVETGHVALLGRLGVNIKDATGATISQEEAVRRLSAMYGGQADAYSKTFAGRMATLREETNELAENIGGFLIPKIEALAHGLNSTIEFFERNRDAAIALAIVVGGPLATAIAVYIAQQVTALTLKVADFFTSAAQAAIRYATAMGPGMLTAIGAVTAALGFLTYQMVQNQNKAREWAANLATAAGSPKDAIRKLTDEADHLQAQLDAHGLVAHVPFVRMAVGAQGAEDKIVALRAEAARLQAQLDGQAKTAFGAAGGLEAIGTAADAGAPKLSSYQQAVDTLHDSLANAEDKAKAFKTVLDSLLGAPISAEKAQIQFLDSVQSLGESLAKQGSDFNLTSGAGRANRTALEAAVTAARDQLAAMQEAGAPAADLLRAFNEQQTSLVNTLRFYGYASRDINNILAQEGFTPANFNQLLTTTSTVPAGFVGPAVGRNTVNSTFGNVTLQVNGRTLGTITQDEMAAAARRNGLS